MVTAKLEFTEKYEGRSVTFIGEIYITAETTDNEKMEIRTYSYSMPTYFKDKDFSAAFVSVWVPCISSKSNINWMPFRISLSDGISKRFLLSRLTTGFLQVCNFSLLIGCFGERLLCDWLTQVSERALMAIWTTVRYLTASRVYLYECAGIRAKLELLCRTCIFRCSKLAYLRLRLKEKIQWHCCHEDG